MEWWLFLSRKGCYIDQDWGDLMWSDPSLTSDLLWWDLLWSYVVRPCSAYLECTAPAAGTVDVHLINKYGLISKSLGPDEQWLTSPNTLVVMAQCQTSWTVFDDGFWVFMIMLNIFPPPENIQIPFQWTRMNNYHSPRQQDESLWLFSGSPSNYIKFTTRIQKNLPKLLSQKRGLSLSLCMKVLDILAICEYIYSVHLITRTVSCQVSCLDFQRNLFEFPELVPWRRKKLVIWVR